MQAKLEGRDGNVGEAVDDYAVVRDGPVVGRIYRHTHGPSAGTWYWGLSVPPFGNGMAESMEEAKEAIAERMGPLAGGK